VTLPGALVVDFDGTVCLHDVGVCLGEEFGGRGWSELGEAYDRGELTMRQLIVAENTSLSGTREEMLAFVLSHCPLDPTFAGFAQWAAAQRLPITIVSDGSAFHIAPMLIAAGIDGIRIVTNDHRFGPDGQSAGLAFPNAHPECVGCGTCKMRAVMEARERHGTVAFVGDGASDRFGALYSDVVFAKDDLPRYCDEHGVPYRAWTDFDDVRTSLGSDEPFPGAVAPTRCPGWTAA
jgi:2-hydroxy-3-keto-5-methylthiopentenyl-1-phosphate phosphatase